MFTRLGGRIAWRERLELMLIGPRDERWDHCFIAEYQALWRLPRWYATRSIARRLKHRQAAVKDSRLIRHAVRPIGKTFGEIPT